MFTGIVIGLGIAAAIGYVHKVGLPAVLTKMDGLAKRVEASGQRLETAIHAHNIATNGVGTASGSQSTAHAITSGKFTS